MVRGGLHVKRWPVCMSDPTSYWKDPMQIRQKSLLLCPFGSMFQTSNAEISGEYGAGPPERIQFPATLFRSKKEPT